MTLFFLITFSFLHLLFTAQLLWRRSVPLKAASLSHLFCVRVMFSKSVVTEFSGPCEAGISGLSLAKSDESGKVCTGWLFMWAWRTGSPWRLQVTSPTSTIHISGPVLVDSAWFVIEMFILSPNIRLEKVHAKTSVPVEKHYGWSLIGSCCNGLHFCQQKGNCLSGVAVLCSAVPLHWFTFWMSLQTSRLSYSWLDDKAKGWIA